MQKIVSIVFIILVIVFFGSTYKYYSSNKNIKNKEFNRNNIDDIINVTISFEWGSKHVVDFTACLTFER